MKSRETRKAVPDLRSRSAQRGNPIPALVGGAGAAFSFSPRSDDRHSRALENLQLSLWPGAVEGQDRKRPAKSPRPKRRSWLSLMRGLRTWWGGSGSEDSLARSRQAGGRQSPGLHPCWIAARADRWRGMR